MELGMKNFLTFGLLLRTGAFLGVWLNKKKSLIYLKLNSKFGHGLEQVMFSVRQSTARQLGYYGA